MLNRRNIANTGLKNATIYVGNTPAKRGVMGNDADLCATYAGPIGSSY
jgi:hypothetical protein